MLAGEIMNYVTALQTVITRLQVTNGCEDIEISFNNTVVAGEYINPHAPPDNTCDVFHPDGGRLNWRDPPKNSVANLNGLVGNPDAAFQKFFFDCRRHVLGVGQTGPMDSGYGNDIMVRLQVTESVCNAINEKLGISQTPSNGWAYWEPVRDCLSTNPQTGLTCSGNACVGQHMMCFLQTGGPNNVHQFYAVLIAR